MATERDICTKALMYAIKDDPDSPLSAELRAIAWEIYTGYLSTSEGMKHVQIAIETKPGADSIRQNLSRVISEYKSVAKHFGDRT